MTIKLGTLELFSADELAEQLKAQPRTIRHLLATGRIKGRKIARKWYASAESLREYFSQGEPPKGKKAA